MSLSAEQIGEYRAFAEQLADAAAVAIKPYFRASLDVEDKAGAFTTLSRWLTSGRGRHARADSGTLP